MMTLGHGPYHVTARRPRLPRESFLALRADGMCGPEGAVSGFGLSVGSPWVSRGFRGSPTFVLYGTKPSVRYVVPFGPITGKVPAAACQVMVGQFSAAGHGGRACVADRCGQTRVEYPGGLGGGSSRRATWQACRNVAFIA